jgi:hypothetical protein
LITICFIWNNLWNLIFFAISSPFNFLSLIFGPYSLNWYLFYLRWFLEVFLWVHHPLVFFPTNLILILLIIIFFPS